jgi:hypothetical protein
LHFIRQKKYNLSRILSILGLEGVRRVNIFTLKNGLLKLWPGVSEDNALLLSKYISRGKEEVDVEQIVDALNLKKMAYLLMQMKSGKQDFSAASSVNCMNPTSIKKS